MTKSSTNKHVVPFDAATEKIKGKGFHYKGAEFIHHTSLHNHETAFYTLLTRQKVVIAGFIFLIIAALILNWHLTIVIVISALTILYFFDLLFNGFLVYRSLTREAEIKISIEEIDTIPEADWPMYTIFCPLYKEWQVVPQFVEAMNELEYPKDKLQIMFLLEESDKETIQKIKAENLPAQFEIVIVPHSNPKTKPKAMNYGLQHVKGEYLVIYDAEDVPSPLQLKRAVLAFTKVDKKTVCIQAKLNFYNPNQNLLTKLFSAEYSLWFELILPGLQSINAPIPLGGTSNHFKTSAITELEGWDAFNVTEDADLGMRIAKNGYKTAILQSTTYEEANSAFKNWYNQRSRWIKGYIQTYFVHTRQHGRFIKEGSLKDFLIFHFIIGEKILSIFVNLFMWTLTISYFLFRGQIGTFIESFFPGPILYIGVFTFIFGNFCYMYFYMIGCDKRKNNSIVKYTFLVPFYWLFMSAAAWQALFEIIFKPHYWAKTVHGLHLVNKANK